MLMLAVLTSCNTVKYIAVRQTFASYFNTITELQIIAEESQLTEGKKNEIYNGVSNILNDIDDTFNIQTLRGEETALMKINKNAGIAPVEVNAEVIQVLKVAIEIANDSVVDDTALFDPTIGVLWNLWNFVELAYSFPNFTIASIPEADDIEAARSLVDYKNIIIDEDSSTVYLKNKGMVIDLGGIVKGYAADKIKEYLISVDISRAVISVGGNILLLGGYLDSAYNDIAWNVQLRTPFSEEYADDEYYFGTVNTLEATVVTSGTYEKYLKDKDGNMYHHILDPRTGYPFNNNVVSCSVITDQSIKADGLSTMLFALGLEAGMAYVNQHQGLDVVYVVEEGNKYFVYTSSDVVFTMNEKLLDKNYVFKGEDYE